jgi:hypothetical protein
MSLPYQHGNVPGASLRSQDGGDLAAACGLPLLGTQCALCGDVCFGGQINRAPNADDVWKHEGGLKSQWSGGGGAVQTLTVSLSLLFSAPDIILLTTNHTPEGPPTQRCVFKKLVCVTSTRHAEPALCV